MSDIVFNRVFSVAAMLLAAFALYRTRQLDVFDLELVHASSRRSDTVCDLIEEVQSLRTRIEALEKLGTRAVSDE